MEMDKVFKNILVLLGSAMIVSCVFRPEMAVKSRPFLVYVLPPTANLRILPTTDPVAGDISDTISVVACPGEYEPASFVIHALADLTSLRLEPSDLGLQKGKGIIASSNVDIKIVKCWYQSGGKDVVNEGKKVLLPELLLNDDSLVRVDTKEQENYLKLNFPEGKKYVCISKKEGIPKKGRYITNEEFPVKDSPVLQPVNIPKDTNKQFWITVRIPDDVLAGTYAGNIKIRASAGAIGEVKLRVRVLPFKLARPGLIYSIWYSGSLQPQGDGYLGTISCSDKTEEQLKKELENLKSHGIANPCFQTSLNPKGPKNVEATEKYLRMREEIFGKGLPLYCNGFASWDGIPIDMVKGALKMARFHGIAEVYFYGMDEATGEKLKSQRGSWKAVHAAGGKVFVAGSAGTFERMGDLLDLFIRSSSLNAKEAGRWHAEGHQIFSYANPQCGVENPLVYRRNYGLSLWQADYDGALSYAYQGDFGNIWDDFDAGDFGDYVFAYPTVNGVIDTIQWEGWREGVDDVRYLTTLSETIAKVKTSKDKNVSDQASLAEKYVRELKSANLLTRNPDTIRMEIIQHILDLTGKK